MKAGVVPSDASLRSDLCPFYCQTSLPRSTEVRWLTPKANWAQSESHRNAITRFYQLFFAGQDAQLTRVTNDIDLAFTPTLGNPELGLVEVEPRGGAYIGMTSVVQASTQVEHNVEATVIPVAQRTTETVRVSEEAAEAEPQTPDVDRLMQDATQDSDRIFVAINWAAKRRSAASSADIDMWIRSKNMVGELNFGNKSADFGRLYRDVRRSGRINASADQFRSWECAEIYHNRLEDLTFWVNAYSSDHPVTIRLIVVWKGQRRETSIDLNCSEGDGAGNADRRDRSDAWMRVDLLSQLDWSTETANR